MTHVELIEAILEDYEKEFKSDPTEDEKVNSFREGVVFAYNYLLTVLKNGNSWTYEKEKG